MSRDLEGLRRGFEAFWERGDWSALEILPDDFVSESHFFFEFRANGREGFARIFKELHESFPERVLAQSVEDVAPDLVLVEIETGDRGSASAHGD